VGAAGLALSYVFYIVKPLLPGKIASGAEGVHTFLYRKWYFDELYNAVFVQGALKLGQLLWKKGDVATIDRFGPNGFARLSQQGGMIASRLQSGFLYHYAFAMMLGLLALISWFAYVTLWGV
jgi:NADH-quinone oxidoreductase subunit L